MIWKRTIASQMTDATGETVTVRLDGTATDGRVATVGASGTVITHPGHLKAYEESSDDADGDDDRNRRLPPMAEGDTLNARDLEARGHETQPPSRYTEASLVKRLADLEIGRSPDRKRLGRDGIYLFAWTNVN
jgi:DNA topoisomerase-1